MHSGRFNSLFGLINVCLASFFFVTHPRDKVVNHRHILNTIDFIKQWLGSFMFYTTPRIVWFMLKETLIRQ